MKYSKCKYSNGKLNSKRGMCNRCI